MSTRTFLYLILLLACFSAEARAQKAQIDLETLYEKLDSLIDCRQQIYADKEKRIEIIRSGLDDRRISDAERYSLQERLYNEYTAFKYDSAYKYVTANMEIAQRMGDPHRLAMSQLHLTHILSVSGLFDQAQRILDGLQVDALDDESRVGYYNQMGELNLFLSEFAVNTKYYKEYHDNAQEYRKHILELTEKNTYAYTFAHAVYLCESGHVKEAVKEFEAYLPQLRRGTRDYSVVTSTLAYFYSHLQQDDLREQYLLLSAISDAEAAISENNSLRELSAVLLANGDTDRAFRYLNVAIENANFYGTRLRNQQAAQLVPSIVSTYDDLRTAQSHRAKIFILILLLGILALVGSSLLLLWVLRKRKEANRRVREVNGLLNENVQKLEETSIKMKESNKIKDEYIGRFLELCSSYIDRADEQRKLENRLARDRKLPELYAELKSSRYINELTSVFYQNFDATFLKIYPTFVEEVNRLLEPENRIEPKGEKLNTELRVLALIRLGINDNQKIADILRSSITTIYTYRSKLKAKARRKDSFEDEVKIIESFL